MEQVLSCTEFTICLFLAHESPDVFVYSSAYCPGDALSRFDYSAQLAVF